MPPASPRKSSTSSGNRSPPRPRYLGVEAAGSPPFPPGPPAGGAGLRGRLPAPAGRVRIVRAEGARAVVEVEHGAASIVRAAWNGAVPGGPTLATRRTWGTLVGAKAWLHRAPASLPTCRPGRPEADGRRDGPP